MGRYLGAKHKLSRRFAENIGGYTKTPLARKPYRPGQHGPNGRRRKLSTFGRGLEEKQKLKAYYNIREKTLRRVFQQANKLVGNTGENLLQLLERRLDNVVYRIGLALTPRCARQLVSHGHIEVDGKRVNVSNFLVSPGQTISVREKSQKHPQVLEALQEIDELVSYVKRDNKSFSGSLVTTPKREDIPVHIEERFIVEFLTY